jgi:hypothetical protein
MLGYRLLRDVEVAADFAGGTRSIADKVKDVSPTRLNKCGEDRLRSHAQHKCEAPACLKSSLYLHKSTLV